VTNSYTAPLKDLKIDANGARASMGHFLRGVDCRNSKAFCERPFALQGQQPEKDKRNVEVAAPLEKYLQTPTATFLSFTFSASFDVWANQTKLIMYKIENKTKNIMTTQSFLNSLLFTTQLLKCNTSSVHLHCIFVILECSK